MQLLQEERGTLERKAVNENKTCGSTHSPVLTEGPHGLDLRAAREVVFLQVGANYLNEGYLLLVSPRTGEVLFFCLLEE